LIGDAVLKGCVQVLCRHAKHWHLYVRLPQHLSENIKDTKDIFCQGGKGSLTLFAHAMQGAAEIVLNRRTGYTCQAKKEILTLLVHAMQGAAEMVLDRCTRYIDTDGSIVELSDEKKKELGDMISSMADKGLRTLCLSYRDYQTDSENEPPEESPDEDLTACCVVGIKVCVVFVRFCFNMASALARTGTSSKCRNTFLLSPCVSELRLSTVGWTFLTYNRGFAI